MTEDEKWIVGVGLTLLGIFIGYAARAYSRVKSLIDKDEMSKEFWTRREQEAFQRMFDAYCLRIHEDFLQPFRQQTQVLFNQSVAIAEQGKTLQHVVAAQDRINDAMDRMNEQLAELVEHSLHRRATDPPAT